MALKGLAVRTTAPEALPALRRRLRDGQRATTPAGSPPRTELHTLVGGLTTAVEMRANLTVTGTSTDQIIQDVA